MATFWAKIPNRNIVSELDFFRARLLQESDNKLTKSGIKEKIELWLSLKAKFWRNHPVQIVGRRVSVRCCFHGDPHKERRLYSAANDPRPQMFPIPEMIPKLNRKRSRIANDPWCGPQMIPEENEEWYKVCFPGLFKFFYCYFLYSFIFINKTMN